MEIKLEDGVKVPSPGKNDKADHENKAWGVWHSTPGVGSYNISR